MAKPFDIDLSANEVGPDDIRRRWRPLLRAAGLKCTEQRLAVLRELEQAKHPVSHRDIMDRLSNYEWDSTTFFRNLVDLFEAGFLTRFDVGDHTWRYELRRGDSSITGQHPHFLCTSCGSITCLPGVSLTAVAEALQLLALDQTVEELLVKGRCRDCCSPER
jgi:Fur family ferric uptake transcriptional regulator